MEQRRFRQYLNISLGIIFTFNSAILNANSTKNNATDYSFNNNQFSNYSNTPVSFDSPGSHLDNPNDFVGLTLTTNPFENLNPKPRSNSPFGFNGANSAFLEVTVINPDVNEGLLYLKDLIDDNKKLNFPNQNTDNNFKKIQLNIGTINFIENSNPNSTTKTHVNNPYSMGLTKNQPSFNDPALETVTKFIEPNKINDLGTITIETNNNSTTEKAEASQMETETETEKLQAKNKKYNRLFSLARLIMGTTVISYELIVLKNAPSIEYAFLSAFFVGCMSAGVQLNNHKIYNWLKDSFYVEDTIKKLGLISNNESQDYAKAKELIKTSVFYGKWGLMEVSFLAAAHLSMTLAQVSSGSIALTLLTTTLATIWSQGYYDRQVSLKEIAISNSNIVNAQEKSIFFKHAGLWVGSTISVLTAVATLLNIPFSYIGFVFLRGAGYFVKTFPFYQDKSLKNKQTNGVHLNKAHSGKCQKLFL